MMQSKLCMIVENKLNLARDSNEKARAFALTKAVDLTITHLNKFGWGSHLYNAMPSGAAPWQGQCLTLSKAALDAPELGRAWRQDTRAFAAFYNDYGFFRNEGSLTVGSDQLIYRSLAEEHWLQANPSVGSNWASTNASNLLLVGLLNLP